MGAPKRTSRQRCTMMARGGKASCRCPHVSGKHILKNGGVLQGVKDGFDNHGRLSSRVYRRERPGFVRPLKSSGLLRRDLSTRLLPLPTRRCRTPLLLRILDGLAGSQNKRQVTAHFVSRSGEGPFCIARQAAVFGSLFRFPLLVCDPGQNAVGLPDLRRSGIQGLFYGQGFFGKLAGFGEASRLRPGAGWRDWKVLSTK